MKDFLKTLKNGVSCRCPKCMTGALYASTFDLKVKETCDHCGLNLAQNDSADGPAVFLIFVLGFALVPLALIFDHFVNPPLWAHAIIWSAVTLGLTIGSLKPIKSYIIYLQFKHRPNDWK